MLKRLHLCGFSSLNGHSKSPVQAEVYSLDQFCLSCVTFSVPWVLEANGQKQPLGSFYAARGAEKGKKAVLYAQV